MKKLVCFILAVVLLMTGLFILPSCTSNEEKDYRRPSTDPLTEEEAIMIAQGMLESKLKNKHSEVYTPSYGTVSCDLSTSYDGREYWHITLKGSYRYIDADEYGRGTSKEGTFSEYYSIENAFGAGMNEDYLPYSHWFVGK